VNIKTTYDPKPIPDRRFDWSAIDDDRPGKFNWWKNSYKFKSEIEAVTWAWKAWEFKTGQRSRID